MKFPQTDELLLQERSQCAKLYHEIATLKQSQAEELTQAWRYARQLLARDEEMRQQLAQARSKIEELSALAEQLGQSNSRIAELQESGHKAQLETSAAQAALEQARQKIAELEAARERLSSQLQHGQQELERAQAARLDRDHRYRASLKAYEDRDRSLQANIQTLTARLGAAQADLRRATDGLTQGQQRERDSEEAVRSFAERLTAELNAEKKKCEHAERAALDERKRLQSSLQSSEERLAFSEEQLSKVSAEAAMLRSGRGPARRPSAPRADGDLDFSLDLDLLARLTQPGELAQD